MTDGAVFGGLVKVFEEGAFVELGFRFDELIIDELEQSIRAGSEGVMDGFFDGISTVAGGVVDIDDGMATCAGDAGLGCGMIDVVEVGIIECAAEEGHLVVASGAETSGADVAIAGEGDFAGFADGE